MEQILLAYGLPKETVAAIMILYRNTEVKVRSPDGDTEYFDIVAGVLQGDTLAPYLFIICLDYVLRTSIDKIRENGFWVSKRLLCPVPYIFERGKPAPFHFAYFQFFLLVPVSLRSFKHCPRISATKLFLRCYTFTREINFYKNPSLARTKLKNMSYFICAYKKVIKVKYLFK